MSAAADWLSSWAAANRMAGNAPHAEKCEAVIAECDALRAALTRLLAASKMSHNHSLTLGQIAEQRAAEEAAEELTHD